MPNIQNQGSQKNLPNSRPGSSMPIIIGKISGKAPVVGGIYQFTASISLVASHQAESVCPRRTIKSTQQPDFSVQQLRFNFAVLCFRKLKIPFVSRTKRLRVSASLMNVIGIPPGPQKGQFINRRRTRATSRPNGTAIGETSANFNHPVI